MFIFWLLQGGETCVFDPLKQKVQVLRPPRLLMFLVPSKLLLSIPVYIFRTASIHRNVRLNTCRKTNNTLPRSAYNHSGKVTRISWSNSLDWLSNNFRLRATNRQTKLKSDYEAFLRTEGWQLLARRGRGRLHQRKIVAMVAMYDGATTIIGLKTIQTLHLPHPSRLNILQKSQEMVEYEVQY